MNIHWVRHNYYIYKSANKDKPKDLIYQILYEINL